MKQPRTYNILPTEQIVIMRWKRSIYQHSSPVIEFGAHCHHESESL
jgi:hypothetical protein